MAVLNLFPARVRFVNDDGTLTNEAYRALQILFDRVGGALGDTGSDTFSAVFWSTSEQASVLQTDIVQPTFVDQYYAEIVQSVAGNVQDKVIVKPGTVTAPSITTENDDNTGIYFPAADTVGIATNGVQRVSVANAGVTVTGTATVSGLVTAQNALTVSAGVLTTLGGATFHTTSSALTNGSGAGAGTITNAPAAGNPTKWIGINDNGTTRYIPSW